MNDSRSLTDLVIFLQNRIISRLLRNVKTTYKKTDTLMLVSQNIGCVIMIFFRNFLIFGHLVQEENAASNRGGSRSMGK